MMKRSQNSARARSRERVLTPLRVGMLALVFLVAAGFISARLVKLQAFSSEHYRKLAKDQREGFIRIPAKRGSLFDTHGKELALSIDVASIYAVPPRVADKKKTARELARRLGLNYGTVLKKLSNEKKSFVWIKRKVDSEVWDALQKDGFDARAGFGSLRDTRRIYPHQDFASQVLGYVGIDENGLAGIELTYDRYIRGTPGEFIVLKRPSGAVAERSESYYNEPTAGWDVTLTLDEVLQHYTERELNRIVEEFRPDSACIVVMDARNGAILAMGSRPSADPNLPRLKGDAPRWRNRTVEDCYEPGSTFKIFVTAAALDRGLVSPAEMIPCGNGSIEVAGMLIHDHESYDTLSLAEVISHSSNVGAISVGMRIPKEEFYRSLKGLGFGSKTGVDLPGESSGILRGPDKWSASARAFLSIGQSISASPLQIVRAMAAIANGGRLVTPHVMEKIVDRSGRTVKRSDAPAQSIVFSKETLTDMRRMMEGVVEEGTGTKAAVHGYRVAGKTGTAQKADPRTGTYAENSYVSSFVGFLPVQNPEVVIAVVVDNPKGGRYYGGDVAAPAFSRIAQAAMRQRNILPSSGKGVLTLAASGRGESLRSASPERGVQ